jgi:hypothetical protein
MATIKTTQPKLTVLTPQATAAYAFVWQARPSLNVGGEPQFSITLLFDKKKVAFKADAQGNFLSGNKEFHEMKRVAMNAAKKKFGERLPPNLASPFHDGDVNKADDPTFAGKIYINAKSRVKPGIIDNMMQPITSEFDFYSGCMCRATLYAFGYDMGGNKGVSFLLNNLQKLGDGERISGRKRAEEDFDAVELEPEETNPGAIDSNESVF